MQFFIIMRYCGIKGETPMILMTFIYGFMHNFINIFRLLSLASQYPKWSLIKEEIFWVQ